VSGVVFYGRVELRCDWAARELPLTAEVTLRYNRRRLKYSRCAVSGPVLCELLGAGALEFFA
jgi:hypothetical protein